jgi:hypothetical protein
MPLAEGFLALRCFEWVDLMDRKDEEKPKGDF